MVSGIVGGKSSNLPSIADNVHDGPSGPGTKVESRVRWFERWLRYKKVESETFFLPFARGKALLMSLCHDTLTFAIDGSVVGRGCMTLMVSVIYEQRALPLVWTVAKRKKGHFPVKVHIDLLQEAKRLVPEGVRVVLLGDGEFDGVDSSGPRKSV